MDVQIIQGIRGKPQVVIRCEELDDEILRLKLHIQTFGTKLQASSEKETCFVNIPDILYFESVDSRTFLYTEGSVLELKQRLYELEALLPIGDFIRSSKSQIINVGKIKSLKPELNRTISVTMCNGEKLCISRRYVSAVKKLLSL